MKLPSFRAARAKITTAADVAAEIDEHTAILAAARAGLAELDASRHEVLIGDDVAALREHTTKSEDLRTSVERLQARLTALSAQAAEIQAAEAAAALDARRSDVETRAVEAGRWLQETYPQAAQEIVAGLTALVALEQEISKLNEDLSKAGRDEAHLAGVQSRLGIIAGGSKLDEGSRLAAHSPISLASATRLLELVGGVRAPGWEPVAWI